VVGWFVGGVVDWVADWSAVCPERWLDVSADVRSDTVGEALAKEAVAARVRLATTARSKSESLKGRRPVLHRQCSLLRPDRCGVDRDRSVRWSDTGTSCDTRSR